MVLLRSNRPKRVPSSRYGRGNVIQSTIPEGRQRPPPPSIAVPRPPTSAVERELPPLETYEVVDIDERRRSLTIATHSGIEEELGRYPVVEEMILEGDDYEPIDFDPEEIRRWPHDNGDAPALLVVPKQQGGDSASVSSTSSASLQANSGSATPSQVESIYAFDSLSGSSPPQTQGQPAPVESLYSTELDQGRDRVAAQSTPTVEQTSTDSGNDVYGFDRLNKPAPVLASTPATQQESVYSFDRLDQERERAYGFDRLDPPTTQESTYGFDHLSTEGGGGTSQEENAYGFDTLDPASTPNNPAPPPSLPPRPKPSTPITPSRPAPPVPQVTPSNYWWEWPIDLCDRRIICLLVQLCVLPTLYLHSK